MKKEQRLNEWIDLYAGEKKFSGSVYVMKGGEIIFKKHIGYADINKKIPISDDTIFRFYSLTKPFTAIAIMRLFEEGKVDLNEHPGKYIECAEKIDKRITIKMLLQHESGLYEVASVETMAEKRDVNLEEEIEKAAEKELIFIPGTQCEYTNTNFIILSLIVEKFRGMPIYEYFENHLFPEMGMKTAFCDMGDKKVPDMAVGYDLENDKLVPSSYANMHLMSGAGCAAGRAKDVICLYEAIKNNKILKKETWGMIFTSSKISNFGLGCHVFEWYGKLTYQHNGGFSGFRTLQRYVPHEDFNIVIMSNTGFGNARNEISTAVYSVYHDKEYLLDNIEMDKGFA